MAQGPIDRLALPMINDILQQLGPLTKQQWYQEREEFEANCIEFLGDQDFLDVQLSVALQLAAFQHWGLCTQQFRHRSMLQSTIRFAAKTFSEEPTKVDMATFDIFKDFIVLCSFLQDAASLTHSANWLVRDLLSELEQWGEAQVPLYCLVACMYRPKCSGISEWEESLKAEQKSQISLHNVYFALRDRNSSEFAREFPKSLDSHIAHVQKQMKSKNIRPDRVISSIHTLLYNVAIMHSMDVPQLTEKQVPFVLVGDRYSSPQ